jgi:hypothetical protein
LIGALCKHFGWAHDFWRRMGWIEFTTWLEVLQAQTQPAEVDPGSWKGKEQDPWWQQANETRERMRGR